MDRMEGTDVCIFEQKLGSRGQDREDLGLQTEVFDWL